MGRGNDGKNFLRQTEREIAFFETNNFSGRVPKNKEVREKAAPVTPKGKKLQKQGTILI